MKFGGTSVGSAARISATADIIEAASRPVVVVLSAMSGVTNALLAIASGEDDRDAVLDKHLAAARELGVEADAADTLRTILGNAVTPAETVACGELMSTRLMHAVLQKRGIDAVWLDATTFVSVDASGEPDINAICRNATSVFCAAGEHDVYVTQGFICRDEKGCVATLSRGGSDYTATMLGEALGAAEVQIWTDVDGVYTADPRRVNTARCIPGMSYATADTAARRGAKILHPDCIRPAMRGGFAVRVLDSFHPEASGTEISPTATQAQGFVAVASTVTPAGTVEVSLIGNHEGVGTAEVAALLGCDAMQGDGFIYATVDAGFADEAMRMLHNAFIE